MRAFPSMGEVKVTPGDETSWDTVLGQYASRKRLRFVRVETSGDRIAATVLVAEGQKVKRGEALAYYSYLFGLGFTEYAAPCDGEVVGINQVTGTIAIKEAPVPLPCNLPGRVEACDDALGVFLKSTGDLLLGSLGAGYGRSGILEVRAEGIARPEQVSAQDAGKVLVLRGQVNEDFLNACMKYRVAGVVAGSVLSRTLQWYRELVETLDWDEFLARYFAREMRSKEEAPPPPTEISPALVVTEDFGDSAMNQEALHLLSSHQGRRVFLDGGQAFESREMDAEVAPCVFVPLSGEARAAAGPGLEGLKQGDRVRVLRIGGPPVEAAVVEVNEDGITFETGLVVPSVKVRTPDGLEFWAPVLNVEKAD